ncbi:MAG TPA: class II fructose-1,6-bisphosphate aldolase [Firmicutes bacterium]|jgi:fructose-bisphosphate aldolase class II|nr:class II fructose-1,6-bisphosphate aldolase [Bacillota bacterium]
MKLVTLRDILGKAEKGGYAVGAFNANNMEIVQAIIESAVEERSPVIIQASQGAIKYAGLDFIVSMVMTAAESADVPVVLHLDHGTDFSQVMRCIRHGFSSVMYDGSRLPLNENISITKKVVEVARAVGVSVEAELGKIGGTEDDVSVDERDALFTDPQEAKIFVEETGVDALAVAIGTAHGVYKGEPKLDFPRLRKIKELTDVPIVMHGSSGVPDAAIRQAVELGVSKINIDTDIRQAFVRSAVAYMKENPDNIDPRKILAPAKESAKKIIREKMRLFGSSGKA